MMLEILLPHHVTFFIRSDDEDEEFGAYCSDRQVRHQQNNNQCFRSDEFDELIPRELSHCAADQGFLSTIPVTKVEDEPELDNSSDCGAASSIYALETADTNSVDFEKNDYFWIPPEPEDKEDELET